MADITRAYTSTDGLIFRNRPRSIVAALALLLSGILTFSMGLTRLFFVEAMAWTFLIWGALLMYFHLADHATRYEVTDEALIIYTPFYFWQPTRTWTWKGIKRMDLIVNRREARPEDVTMQIYHTAEGSTVIDREDLVFNPQLAAIVAERAGLKAQRGQAMQNFDQIPQNVKETYSWR
jgi:hypothetical protein